MESQKKAGAPKGNQNAKKNKTKKRYGTRLPDGIIALIKSRSAELGVSQAAYIAALVRTDAEKSLWL